MGGLALRGSSAPGAVFLCKLPPVSAAGKVAERRLQGEAGLETRTRVHVPRVCPHQSSVTHVRHAAGTAVADEGLQCAYVCVCVRACAPDYGSPVRRNEVLIPLVLGANLENTTLSERSQAWRVTCHMTPLTRSVRSRLVCARAAYVAQWSEGMGVGGVAVNRYRVSLWGVDVSFRGPWRRLRRVVSRPKPMGPRTPQAWTVPCVNPVSSELLGRGGAQSLRPCDRLCSAAVGSAGSRTVPCGSRGQEEATLYGRPVLRRARRPLHPTLTRLLPRPPRVVSRCRRSPELPLGGGPV